MEAVYTWIDYLHAMPDKPKIEQAVAKMLKVNMGAKSGERILVLSDFPTASEWANMPVERLSEFVERSLLSKAVYEIVASTFQDCTVGFCAYPSVGRNAGDPGTEVAERMKSVDIAIAITTYSLTHTEARENACKAGVRVASMPLFLADMFYEGGSMAADYAKVKKETDVLAGAITGAKEIIVKTPGGTDVRFSLVGRKGMSETGVYARKGAWGNLPAGEAYSTPLEGTGNGRIVVEKGWHPNLEENMTIVFRDGSATQVLRGGKVGDELRNLLRPGTNEEPYTSRRNMAEFGIGTNPNAKRPDNTLESEKIRGTIHIAVGDNAHMGGKVHADLHQDFIQPKPDVWVDGKLMMKGGKLV
jgi:leucyl aminopeptidase (aminopeptidase T)